MVERVEHTTDLRFCGEAKKLAAAVGCSSWLIVTVPQDLESRPWDISRFGRLIGCLLLGFTAAALPRRYCIHRLLHCFLKSTVF